MRDELRDPLRLEHMLDCINRLLEADRDSGLDNVTEKDLSYFGVVKLIEIIGEAAYKITNEFKDAHPLTPWKYIIGMRHILVHGYYQINRQDVLKTIRKDLPILKLHLTEYLKDFQD